MTQTSTENIFKIINNKKSALLLIQNNYNTDTLSSALAFCLYLKKLGKDAKIALNSLNGIEKKYNFLPSLDLIQDKIFDPSKLTLRIKTDRVKAKELSYESKDNSLEIYIKAASENGFKKDDIEIIEKNVSFDLIISIGCKNKSSIGLYNENINFLKDKELINIDIDNKNTSFGTINFINSSSKTLSETILDLINFNNSELIDENIATCLLTGIIDKTNGFKSYDISSETLSNASNLIDLGANKDLIFDNLFNKNLEEIRNNSIILSNLNRFSDEIYFSSVENIIDNFNIRSIFFNEIINIKKAKIFVLFNKINEVIYCEIITSDNISAVELTEDFKSLGDNNYAQFAIASSETQKVIDIVLNKISKKIK